MQAKFMLKLKVSTERLNRHDLASSPQDPFPDFFLCDFVQLYSIRPKSTRLNSLLNENIEKREPYGKSCWLSETRSHCQL